MLFPSRRSGRLSPCLEAHGPFLKLIEAISEPVALDRQATPSRICLPRTTLLPRAQLAAMKAPSHMTAVTVIGSLPE